VENDTDMTYVTLSSIELWIHNCPS